MTKSDQTREIDAYRRRISEAKLRYLLEAMQYKSKILKERERATTKKDIDRL